MAVAPTTNSRSKWKHCYATTVDAGATATEPIDDDPDLGSAGVG